MESANRRTFFVLAFLSLSLVAIVTLRADDDHEDTPTRTAPKARGVDPGADGPSASVAPEPDGCRADARSMAAFAAGEEYDFGSMVSYLTSPSCLPAQRSISKAAIQSGITFSQKAPYKLDPFVRGLSTIDLELNSRLDKTLEQNLPIWMRQSPLSTQEMLPIIGQLALLSPRSARLGITNVIQQEIFAGDARIQQESRNEKLAASMALAKTLVKLGLSEGLIADDAAKGAAKMAELTMADSLARYFRGLAAAASVEPSLVPAFNLSAGAVNTGVNKAYTTYEAKQRAEMLTSLFVAVRAALQSGSGTDPGAAELNEAMRALIGGNPLTETGLRKLWKEAVFVLAQSTTQPALADAVARSLTPQLVLLAAPDRKILLAAGKNYGTVAVAIQSKFLAAWHRVRDLKSSNSGSANQFKRTYLEPFVSGILEFDAAAIEGRWLQEVLAEGLILDADIERRFPRFVLSLLDRRERAAKVQLGDDGPEDTTASLADQFAVLWTLQTVHVPALTGWVKRHEK